MKKSFSRLCGILLLAALTPPLHAGKVLAEVEYFYAQDNTLVGKAFNGKRVNFEYDLRGQLLAVTDAEGNDLERYTYDPAGNRLSKTIDGVTTTYRYDNANQLVSSTSDGVTTQYRYDAAGRMVQSGDKTYYYNFGNNKVSEVKQNGKTIAKFEYNLDGQISKAIYGDKTEEFIWDGLALVWRSGVTYVNEPYVTGGNPILAGDDVLFNDMLGTTLAVNENPVEMTSFGETNDSSAFFTGKPMVEELGYSFLFRDYNPSHGRWTTADPLGYPDGWNNLAYCGNSPLLIIDSNGEAWSWVAVATGAALGAVGYGFNCFISGEDFDLTGLTAAVAGGAAAGAIMGFATGDPTALFALTITAAASGQFVNNFVSEGLNWAFDQDHHFEAQHLDDDILVAVAFSGLAFFGGCIVRVKLPPKVPTDFGNAMAGISSFLIEITGSVYKLGEEVSSAFLQWSSQLFLDRMDLINQASSYE